MFMTFRYAAAFLLFAFGLVLAGPALAQVVTSTGGVTLIGSPEAVLGVVQAAALAFKGGAWALGAGLMLALVVAALRFLRLLEWLDDAHDKWVALAISTLTSVGVGLQTGRSAVEIITAGVAIGVTAIGGWELLLKKIRDLAFGRARA